jgi:ribosomal protein S18 acetylase RimI-like enzyme
MPAGKRGAISTAIREFNPADQPTCERILRALPEWFGIESSLVQYVKDTLTMRTWLAECDGAAVGFLTLKEHNPRAAEIHCIAVLPQHHRHGIGRALVDHAERHLTSRGFKFLQVKTLGPSRPSAEYALTRQFYESLGFVALEEFPTLWPGNPCLLLVKAL